MWCKFYKAGNMLYRSQDTHSNFTLCDHIRLFESKARVAARDYSTITLAQNIFEKLSNFMKIHPVGAKSFHADKVNDNIYFIK
jgi:hypothetical protein